MILFQFLMVSTRTVIKTIRPRTADELDEILITLVVLGQYDEVVASKVFFRLTQIHISTTGHIHLTTKDGLERIKSVLLALFVNTHADVVKFLNTEHVSMIGNSHALHAIVNGFIHKLFDARLTIQNRVVCMYMQMYEIFHCFI